MNANDWAAWGPTIVSAIMCVFFGGVVYARQNAQSDQLKEHDVQLEDHARDIKSNTIEIGTLKAFRDGYATARALYDKTLKTHVSGD